jgi:hypothetical protein
VADFKFPSAGPRVLVQNCVIESNDGYVTMKTDGAHARGFANVHPRTATLKFEVLLRELSDMNPLLQHVRQFGAANLSDPTILLEDMRATASILKEENDALRDVNEQLRNATIPELTAKLRNALASESRLRKEAQLHENTLMLLKAEEKGLKDPIEALAISVVRSWCVALTQDGKFDQMEIRNLVERLTAVLGIFRNANYMPPIEAAPSTEAAPIVIPDDAPLF